MQCRANPDWTCFALDFVFFTKSHQSLWILAAYNLQKDVRKQKLIWLFGIALKDKFFVIYRLLALIQQVMIFIVIYYIYSSKFWFYLFEWEGIFLNARDKTRQNKSNDMLIYFAKRTYHNWSRQWWTRWKSFKTIEAIRTEFQDEFQGEFRDEFRTEFRDKLGGGI